MRLYLDNCCYNRPHDDQGSLRIRLETGAKLRTQRLILERRVELAWSYILDLENERNPFEERRDAIGRWRQHAVVDTGETPEILSKAALLAQMGHGSKDALHLACASALECTHFLTTDDRLIRKAAHIKGMKVYNPVCFIREECACLPTGRLK